MTLAKKYNGWSKGNLESCLSSLEESIKQKALKGLFSLTIDFEVNYPHLEMIEAWLRENGFTLEKRLLDFFDKNYIEFYICWTDA